MRAFRLLFPVAIVFTACGAETREPADTGVPREADGSPDAGSSPDAGTPVACVPGRSCLEAGENTFEVGGLDRTVTVMLPTAVEGAPVLFAWHYLQGSPSELVAWMKLGQLRDAGYVVVVPRSRAVADTEWDVISPPEANADVALFDALRSALLEQHHVDGSRVYATGFSAGGLFTTYLTMYRAPVLRATAPFSGGVPEGAYSPPASDLPVLISWGGTGDALYGFDFDAAAHLFASSLSADGHPVTLCEHALGHWLPDDATAHLRAFLDDHAHDASTEWRSAPTRVPAGCVLADQAN